MYYNKFPDHLKNVDYFLAQLSSPILSCFSKSPMQYRYIFELPPHVEVGKVGISLYEHPILVNFQKINPLSIVISENDSKIVTLIYEFFCDLIGFSEYVNCDCHDTNEYQAKIKSSFDSFVKNLIEAIGLDRLEKEVSANTSPLFFDDYSSILSDLFKEKHNLEQAQKSLLYWNDAIPHVCLQKALVALHYRYIEHLANRKASNVLVRFEQCIDNLF